MNQKETDTNEIETISGKGKGRNERSDSKPLALVPAPLRNGRQSGNAEVTALKALGGSPGHNPNQLFVVRFAALAGVVGAHALGHQLLPSEQLSVADLQSRQETAESENVK